MELIDNVNSRLVDDLKQTIGKGSRLHIAGASFSIYAYEALKTIHLLTQLSAGKTLNLIGEGLSNSSGLKSPPSQVIYSSLSGSSGSFNISSIS